MAIAGDRVNTKCKGCGAQIVMIMSVAGKWIPCDPTPYRVDGERVLVFADGVTGREHKDAEVGHQAHFVTCPKARQFRKPVQERAKESDKPLIGCGCLTAASE
jgi:hypothetical protein